MSTYNPYHPRTVRGAPRRSNPRHLHPGIFVVALLSVGIGIAFYVSSRTSHMTTQAQEVSVPDALNLPTPVAAATPVETQQSETLSRAVHGALVDTEGSYAVVVKHLGSGEYYAQQQSTTYDAASLYKLWVMAVIYEYIKAGRLQPEQVLSADVADLNETFKIASESAEQTEGTVSFTVDEALEQMITISDNYAALLLTDAIRRTSVADFLKRYEFTGSRVGNGEKPPVTTAEDVSRFFEKLYDGQLVDAESSQAMLERLKRQRLNGKIPSELPDEVFVAHKTGELDRDSHDAGIVFAPSGDYVLVVLSRSDDRDAANARISAVSKAVYDHFETAQTTSQ